MNCNLFESRGLRCPKTVKYGGIGLLAALLIGGLATMPIWRHQAPPTQPTLVSVMYSDLNRTRVQNGLRPLAMMGSLDGVALAHARDMATKNYLDHVAPDGSTPFGRMRARGIHFVWAGENIAESDRLDDAENGLWNSPEHRANILNPHFRRVGIAVVSRPDGELLFVQEFTN